MSNHAPGTPELHALIQPHIDNGGYPPTRVLSMDEHDALPSEVLQLLTELDVLLAKQEPCRGDVWPEAETPWAKIRVEICEVLRKLLELKPSLIEIEDVQVWAIETGAIPSPDEAAYHMQYYVLPNGVYAHWKCGTMIRVEEHENGSATPFCPVCEVIPVQKRALRA
jgi:hypothetical protein